MRFGGLRLGGFIAALGAVLGIGAGARSIERQRGDVLTVTRDVIAAGPPPQLSARVAPGRRRRGGTAGRWLPLGFNGHAPAGAKLGRKAAEGKL